MDVELIDPLEQERVMSEPKLSEFLAEHRASEFGLAPVSKAMAVKMAEALEAKLPKMEKALNIMLASPKDRWEIACNELREALAGGDDAG